MLLGKKRFISYAEKISLLLKEEEIVGHVIDTVLKMGASQYCEQILPYASHSTTWIRNKAKCYIQKYGKS